MNFRVILAPCGVEVHTGLLTKKTFFIGFYIFLHRLPAPSGAELGLSTYYIECSSIILFVMVGVN